MSQEITSEESIQAAKALFTPFLDEAGVNEKALARFTAEQLHAEETKFIKIKKTEFDPIHVKKEFPGAKIIAETTAEILLSINVRAWGPQGEAVDRAHKLRGDFAPDKVESHFEIDIGEKLREAISKIGGNGNGNGSGAKED